MLQNANLKIENVKGKRIIVLVASIVIFVLQIAFTTLFLSGLVDYFGTSVSIVGAVELILSIVNIATGAIFEYLFKLALGIVYIVGTVMVIKNFISSITYFASGTFNKANDKRDASYRSLYISLGNTFKWCFVFIGLSLMTSVDFTINESGKVVLIAGTAIYLIVSVISTYFKKLKIETLVYKGLCTVIMLVAYIVLIAGLREASFEQLIQGFRVLFGGYLGEATTDVIFSASLLIAVPILYIILQIFVMDYISDVWYLGEYSKSAVAKEKSGKIMGVSIAVASVSIVIGFILGDLEGVNAEQFITIIFDKAPMLISSIVLFVSYRFSDGEKAKAEVKAEEKPVEKPVEEIEAKKEEVVIEPKKEDIVKEEPKAIVNEEPKKEIDLASELAKYKNLFEQGLISEEEYADKKKQILGL